MKLVKKFAMIFVAVFALVLSLASCDNKTPQGPTVEDAARKIILTQDKQEVSGDFQVPAVVKLDGVTFTVTWKSDNSIATITDFDASYKLVKIDYLHNTTAEQMVSLTATISNGEKSTEKKFQFKVPRFIVQTIAEYDAMLDGENTTVHGIVVAKEEYSASYSNTSIYVAAKDGKGGVYAYRLKCTQEEYDNVLVIGANVYISGVKKMYNGLREYDGACTFILESTEITTPTVLDVTEQIKAGTKLSMDYQNQLIKFSGLEILEIGEKDDKGRFNITVGEGENTFVIRVNTYITPTSGDAYKAYEALNLTPGMIISAQGVCGWYNSAQMHPINASDIVVEGINHGQAMASELASKVVAADGLYGIQDITLPTTLTGDEYANYTATWTSESANVVVSGNVATTKLVAQDEVAVLTVTVKDANGNVKGTATAEVKLISKELATEIITAPVKDTEYYLMSAQKNLKKDLFINGVIDKGYLKTVVDYTKAVKVKLEEVTGGYALYFMDGETKTYINVTQREADATKADITLDAENKTVYTWNTEYNTLVTTQGEGTNENTFYVGTYSSYETFSASNISYAKTSYPSNLVKVVEKTDTMRVEECLEAVKDTLGTESYEKVVELVFALPYRHATLEVALPAEVTTLAWANGKLTITPLEAETEETITVTVTIGEVTKSIEVTVTSELLREVTIAEALELADGKKIQVIGEVKSVDTAWDGSKMSVTITDGSNDYYVYQLSTQVLLGSVIKVTGVTGSYKGSPQVAKGSTAVVIEGPAVIAQVPSMAKGSAVVVSGTVSKINTAWSDDYKNISVTITDGKNTLYVYRLSTKVELGDDITVTGKVDFYNGSVQIAAKATATIELTATAKVEEVADEIASLFPTTSVPQVTAIKLTSKYSGVTFTVTPQENSATLAWDAEKNTLTITPAQTETTETVKVAVVLGEAKVEATYTINSLLSTTGLKAVLAYSDTTKTTNMDGSNQAALLGLDESIFSVVGEKCSQNNNVGLNKAGQLRLYASSGDGNTLTITATGVKIVKIIINFGTTVGAFTVNGTEGSATTAEYTINGTEIVIKNVDASKQVHFTSIEIVYDLAE